MHAQLVQQKSKEIGQSYFC